MRSHRTLEREQSLTGLLLARSEPKVVNALHGIFPASIIRRNASELVHSRLVAARYFALQRFSRCRKKNAELVQGVSEVKLLQRTVILSTYFYPFGVLAFPVGAERQPALRSNNNSRQAGAGEATYGAGRRHLTGG
jgi:hypothetical protein